MQDFKARLKTSLKIYVSRDDIKNFGACFVNHCIERDLLKEELELCFTFKPSENEIETVREKLTRIFNTHSIGIDGRPYLVSPQSAAIKIMREELGYAMPPKSEARD